MVARVQSKPSDDGTVEVQLRRPIETPDRVITSVRVREPEVGDLLSAGDATNDAERSAMLIAAITGIALPHIKRMTMRDFMAIQEAMDGLLGKGESRPTGETS